MFKLGVSGRQECQQRGDTSWWVSRERNRRTDCTNRTLTLSQPLGAAFPNPPVKPRHRAYIIDCWSICILSEGTVETASLPMLQA